MHIYGSGAAYGPRMGAAPSIAPGKPLAQQRDDSQCVGKVAKFALNNPPISIGRHKIDSRPSSNNAASGFSIRRLIASLFAFLFSKKAQPVERQEVSHQSPHSYSLIQTKSSSRQARFEESERKEAVQEVDSNVYDPEVDLPADRTALRNNFCLCLTEAFDFTRGDAERLGVDPRLVVKRDKALNEVDEMCGLARQVQPGDEDNEKFAKKCLSDSIANLNASLAELHIEAGIKIGEKWPSGKIPDELNPKQKEEFAAALQERGELPHPDTYLKVFALLPKIEGNLVGPHPLMKFLTASGYRTMGNGADKDLHNAINIMQKLVQISSQAVKHANSSLDSISNEDEKVLFLQNNALERFNQAMASYSLGQPVHAFATDVRRGSTFRVNDINGEKKFDNVLYPSDTKNPNIIEMQARNLRAVIDNCGKKEVSSWEEAMEAVESEDDAARWEVAFQLAVSQHIVIGQTGLFVLPAFMKFVEENQIPYISPEYQRGMPNISPKYQEGRLVKIDIERSPDGKIAAAVFSCNDRWFPQVDGDGSIINPADVIKGSVSCRLTFKSVDGGKTKVPQFDFKVSSELLPDLDPTDAEIEALKMPESNR